MHSILFVDDEKAILKSLQRMFLGSNYHILYAEDGIKGLQILSENDVEMVISDMWMPKINGNRFLKEVQTFYPNTIRMYLSGCTDEKEIYKAVLDVSAKMYIMKPWEPVELMGVIAHLFKFKDLLESRKILDFINQLSDLPAVTDIYMKLCKLIDNEASTSEISAVIEKDPMTSAKVLQLVNSSFFNKKIGSVKQAVIYLGLNVIKDIVLSTSILDYAPRNSVACFNHKFLSQQSILTNILLQMTYERFLGKNLPENLFAAGLLHDIGLIIMQKHFAEAYSIACLDSKKRGIAFYELENELFSLSHQEIGGYLLEWWGIPYPAVESSLFHHDPLASSTVNRELVCAVHLADYYAWKRLGKCELIKLDDGAFDFLKIEKESYECFVTETLLTGDWINSQL